MSPNNTMVEILVNVVLYSLVFQMELYCLLLVFFLNITHMCPGWSAVTQGCRAWLQVCCRARSSEPDRQCPCTPGIAISGI